jgi:hypothetical protein
MDGIKLRYQRLNISIGSGNRLKDFLISHGWLQSQIVDIGQTRKICLRLTKQAYEALNLEIIPPQHGSISHEYWQQFYAQRFAELGYKISFEVPRISGRVDVVACKNNEKIAVEIETGLSTFIRNIRQDLAAKFDKILVVATDKCAYEKIEKALAKEGLLIPRIQIEQAGKFNVAV